MAIGWSINSSIGAAVAETCCQQYYIEYKQAFDLEGPSTGPRINMTGDLVVACFMAIVPSGENDAWIRLETSQAPFHVRGYKNIGSPRSCIESGDDLAAPPQPHPIKTLHFRRETCVHMFLPCRAITTSDMV